MGNAPIAICNMVTANAITMVVMAEVFILWRVLVMVVFCFECKGNLIF